MIGVVSHHSRKLPEWVGIADFVGVDQGDADTPAGRVARAADNHLGVLQWLAEHTGWCVVLEDDAILCEQFLVCAESALAVAPEPLVSFYLGTGYPSSAQRNIRPAIDYARCSGAAWIIGPLLSSVAYAVHSSILSEVVKDLTTRSGEVSARLKGYNCAYTAPSLVDHTDGPSTVWAPNDTLRKAWWHGDRRDWNTHTVQLASNA